MPVLEIIAFINMCYGCVARTICGHMRRNCLRVISNIQHYDALSGYAKCNMGVPVVQKMLLVFAQMIIISP
jgi:hypothetical protein